MEHFELFTGQRDLERVFAELNLPSLAQRLEPECPDPRGRPRYSRLAFLQAFFLARARGWESTAQLVRELQLNAAFAYFCGFTEVGVGQAVVIRVPHRTTFSRAFAEVCRGLPLLEAQLREIAREYASLVEGFGEDLVVDASVVPTNANPTKRPKGGLSRYTDPDAGIAVKNSPRSLDGKVKVLGYSCHSAVDAKTGCLLDLVVSPGGVHETTLLGGVVDRLLERHPQLPFRSLITDRGYDSKLNNEMLYKIGINPVIHKRRPRGGGLHDGIYTTEGTPTCVGRQPMILRVPTRGPSSGCIGLLQKAVI